MPSAPQSGKKTDIGRLVAGLHAELFELEKQDDLGVLGLDRSADDEAVRAAYLELSRRYHPHRFVRYRSAEASRVAGEIFVKIQAAYGRLTGSHRVPQAETRAVPRTVRKRIDLAVSQAASLLDYHQYDAAIAALDDVLAEDPDHEDAKLWLSLALARKAKQAGDVTAALDAYRDVLELRPDHAEARGECERLQERNKGSLLKRWLKLGG
jgi:cytochrome c-type biogenesis protein CcmH/NrfG